ncbi:MAG: MATE family efflux transporter [Bacteroidaceae bacterium]|nr:MATE family efflux transporter [Bacteroidaceae bacterium]
MSLDFYHMSPGRLFTKMFFPTLLGMFSGSVMNITDGMFVGQRVGSDALAAINIAAPVFMLVTGIALMFGIGASVRASISLAQGKTKEANREITTSLLVAVTVVTLLSAIILLNLDTMAYLFGSTDRLLPLVKEYMLWVTVGMPASCVLFAGMFYVRLDGAPKFAMWCEIIGAGLNILLDYVFIYPLNMGIMGAAIASSLSCLVGALLIMGYLIFFTKRIQLCSLRAAFGRSARWLQTTWQQVKLGLSGFLGEVAISLMLVLGNYVFGSLLGESGVAAYSIACYCSPLFFMINNAIAQSAQPIISYDYGARRWERVRHTLRLVLTVAIVCSVVMTTLIILLTDPLVSLFVKDDPTTHALAVKGMPLFAVDLLFLAVNVTMIGYFQSIKRGTWATVFTTLRGYIFLMFSFIILPLVWGVPGAWLAIPVAEGLTTVCIVLFIFSFKRNVVRT